MLALTLLLATAPAPRLALELQYDAADTTCPPKQRLQSAVAVRLGLDPFTDAAQERVRVTVRRSHGGLTALVVRTAPSGELGRRELESPTDDCTELFSALELAVAIAIDPRAGLVRAPPPKPPPALTGPAPAPPLESPPQPLVFSLGVGPTGSAQTGPTPTIGLALLASVTRGALELGVGGRVELPSSLDVPGGRVTTQAIVGSLTGCFVVASFRACLLSDLGALRVNSTSLTPPARQTVVYADVGARVALQVLLAEWLALRPFLDATASLARTTVVADGAPVWVTPPLSATLGLAVALVGSR